MTHLPNPLLPPEVGGKGQKGWERSRADLGAQELVEEAKGQPPRRCWEESGVLGTGDAEPQSSPFHTRWGARAPPPPITASFLAPRTACRALGWEVGGVDSSPDPPLPALDL